MHALMETLQRIFFRFNESKLAVFSIGEIAIMGRVAWEAACCVALHGRRVLSAAAGRYICSFVLRREHLAIWRIVEV